MSISIRSQLQVRQVATRSVLALVIMIGFVTLTSMQAHAQTLSILHSFKGGADGLAPYGALIRDAGGNFYGTTVNGGTFNRGTVFKLDSAGNETILHSFGGSGDGALPQCALVRDPAGNLYGTTVFGGTQGQGSVFKIDGNSNETVMYSFTGGSDGQNPYAALVRDSAGNLYGTTSAGGAFGYGTVFRLDTSGVETVLHTFGGVPDGSIPYAALVTDKAGNFYGATSAGGTDNLGTVFKLSATGQETVLHSFTGGNDGLQPLSTLLMVSDNLYGTTFGDFHIWAGTVFKVTTAGQSRTLYKFSGGADGKWPSAGLIRDSEELFSS